MPVRPILLLALFFMPFVSFGGTLDSVRCYVWDFAMRDGTRNNLTRQLTIEFEEKLTRKKICTVLERRNYARLIAHRDNERGILRLEGISKATVDTLKAYDANTVVFGEVYDDINSGSYKITIAFQNFDNTKNVWSVSIRRGLINDASSRETAMEELVKLIADDSNAGEREAGRKKYYVEISRALNEFILRAKNLKDGLRFLADLTHGNKKIAENLTLLINQYNQIVDSLKINNNALVEAVSANWQKPELTQRLRQLLRYALLDLHETEILVCNEMIVKAVAVANGKITDDNEVKMIKTTIKTSVPGRVESINAKVTQFERDVLLFLDDIKI